MRTVGVEEELLLVDVDRATATPVAEQVLDEASENNHPVEHEFKREQVEIASDPCTELDQVRAQLRLRRSQASESARAVGADIAALATNPGKLRPRATPDERYLRMVEEFGLLAREQLTCGQHIHVSVDSRAEGVAVLDRIRVWLPVLVALSANSPYWQEQDTGYESFRTPLWGRWPSAGPTDPFGDEAGYEAAVREQIESGGALDDGMIYFDCRLSARYPTVEIRVADVCTDVDDAVLLAGLARGLVDTAYRQWQQGEPVPALSTAVLRGATWRAARFGVTGTLVNPDTGRQEPAWAVIDMLRDRLAPALRENGDVDFVTERLDYLKRCGTGSARQRAAYAEGGDFDKVVLDAVQRTLTS